LDEIKVTIVTSISNLGKTIDAGNEVDTAVPEIKELEISDCTSRQVFRDLLGSILPVTVAAELEFDSVSPPPDTVEEDSVSSIPTAPIVHAKVNSKREIS
jgi:hypothetical protein